MSEIPQWLQDNYMERIAAGEDPETIATGVEAQGAASLAAFVRSQAPTSTPLERQAPPSQTAARTTKR